jgi:DNA topoisomerase-1
MKNLVIVESPSKAKTIEKYLGKEYKVVATVGHVIDLPKSKLGVDIESGKYEPEFTTIRGKGALIKRIKKDVPKDGDGTVYLAMDPDREGEAIAWHIANALKLDNAQRIVFHEITKKAVNEAIEKPRNVDQNLVEAQIARRVLDRLVGYPVSQLLWHKIWYGLSAGRVQSVALRLIVEREKEIEAFIPEEFWDIFANFEDNNENPLKAKLSQKDDKKLEIIDEKSFKSLKKDVENNELEVVDIKVRKVSKKPFAPFTTSTMQQAANNIFGFTAKRTMALAQMLYQSGHITYMRTDSTHLSDEAVSSIRKHIEKRHGTEYLPENSIVYKTKSKNAQEAHEAIRPSNINTTFEMINKEMGKDEAKLYGLIMNRAVASQMVNRESEILTVSLDVLGKSNSKYTFKLGGEKVLFDGFRKVLGSSSSSSDEKGDELQMIEKLSKGDRFNLDLLDGQQKFTKPKARYTDASLVKALEEHGVGRPSTYATIISTVQARGYVEKQGRSLYPLDVGRVVYEFLNSNFDHLVDYNYTAEVEEKLDQISRGEIEYAPFIDDQYTPLIKEIDTAEKSVNKEDVVVLGTSEEKCDKCGSDMYIRLGRYGKFLSCSTFPTCKGMKGLDGGEDSLDFEKYERPEKCPDCGKDLELKQGKYGKFWACTTYPDCKGTVPMLIKDKCPECDSNLVERRSKWGKEFIGCSGYPDCKYIKKEPKKKKEE